MEEQFVTYEIALKLKELGFDECCLAVYFKNKFQLVKGFNINNVNLHEASEMGAILAPLWQQVIDWLREELNIHLYLPKSVYGGYVYVVDSKYSDTIYKDYYDAREQAILKAIELCQKEK